MSSWSLKGQKANLSWTLLQTSSLKVADDFGCKRPHRSLETCYSESKEHHIYATMVAKHVQEMMTEAPHDSPTGQLIRTSIEQAKLELGLEGRLFDHNFKVVGHLLSECWNKNVWKQTSENGIRMIKPTTSLKIECPGDIMLMEGVMHYGYKGKELSEVSKCRLYL
jgi:hypothetical protein